MIPNHLACLIHNSSACGVRDREYPLIKPGPPAGYVFFETICNLLRDEDSLPFLRTLEGSEVELSALDISGGQFQNLADSHSSTNLLIFGLKGSILG